MNENKNITQKKAVALIILIGIIAFIAGSFSPIDKFHKKVNQGMCNVALIKIEGYLGSSTGQIIDGEVVGASSDVIIHNLLLAEENPQIKAVLVSIDSSGGDIFAGEEIANALKSLTKPSIAVIRSVGLSSAYLASTGARAIYASPMSSVGDIGITSSYLDQTEKDRMEGLKYIELTSTKYKDVGNPHRPLSQEEKNLWLKSIKQDHENFVSEVAINRNLLGQDVSEMADGTSMDGQSALDAGLIDGIGDIFSMTDIISNEIGQKAEICWD